MKKRIVPILLMVLLFASLILTGAPGVQAEETEEAVHSDHCICGGCAEDVHESHACASAEWTALPEGTVDFGTLDSGNYYLTADVQVTAITDIQDKTISICLNGHNITTKSSRVFGRYLQTGTTLNICDCSYDAQSGTWDGTVTGGTATFGTILWSDDGAQVNLFGGNLTGNGSHSRKAGLIYVSGKTLAGAYTGASTLNIYNGVISGGLAGQGGNIFANCKSVVNMYGGVITGGKASYITWDGGNANGQGGNIMIDSTATMNLYNGKITAGEAVVNGNGTNRGCGGNMAVSGTFNMYGGEVSNGKASTNTVAKKSTDESEVYDAYTYSLSGCGGNIVSFWSSTRINIYDGAIYGGEANGLYGGNIYINATSPELNIYGGKIWGGKANADMDEANTAALCYGSDVKGGSISVIKGKFTMTGGSIGIDAEGNAAGGRVYPAGAIGGNIYLSANTTVASITGGTIANGTATAGGNIYTLAATSISNATVTAGKATNEAGVLSYGGNIYSKAALTITAANITDGYACHGGNVIQYGSTLDITDSAISGGHADLVLDGNTNGNGGNVYVDSSCVCTITNTDITGGYARRGGNLAAFADVTVTGGSISGGYSYNGGGNVFVYGSGGKLTAASCTISDGVTGGSGGNLCFNINCSGSLDNVKLNGGVSQSSNGSGGSVYVANSTVTVSNSAVTGGNAYNGGALYIGSDGCLTVSASTVSTPTGTRGRAAYVAEGGTLTVQDSELNNTVSAEIAGGTCVWNRGTLKLSGTVNLNNMDMVFYHSVDIMVDCRNSSGAYIDVSELTGQDAPFVFRRWETGADGVYDDTSGVFATGASESHAAMFTPWNTLFLVTLADGQLSLTAGAVQTRGADGWIATYATLEDALAATDENITWYRLIADIDGFTLTQNALIDLYGYKLTDLTIAEGVVLTGMDSTTDDYDCSDGYGLITVSADSKGTIATNVKTTKDQIGSIKRYLTVTTEEGTSFHRFYMGITHMSLKPAAAALGYKATFCGDEMVTNVVDAYGYNIWVDDGEAVQCAKTGAFTSGQVLTLRVQNIMVEGDDVACQIGSSATVNGNVFITFDVDGEKLTLTSSGYSCTLRDMLELINASADSFEAEKLELVRSFCQTFADYMTGWDIGNIVN